MDISLSKRGVKLPSCRASGQVVRIPPPKNVKLLLRQEAARPLIPVVEVGDQVKLGQKVAEGGQGAADLHSPVSGEVKSIEEIPMGDGTKERALVIESDGKDDAIPSEPHSDPLAAEPKVLIERIRQAGIVLSSREARSLAAVVEEALSPRGYISPTGARISKPCRNVAVRFCDQDPHLGALRAVTEAIGDDISDIKLGVAVLLKMSGAEKVHFLFDRKQKAPALEQLAGENDYTVVRLDAGNYPCLSDAMVAKKVSGKEPEISFMRVHQSGVLVVDADTVIEVARAARDGQPVLEKTVSVADTNGCKAVRARIGTSLADISAAVGTTIEIGKVVLGGPMQGLSHHTLDFPLGKEISALTLFSPQETVTSVNDPCVGCGLCAMVCPTRLLPGMLSRYCEYGRWDLAEEAHLFTCIECGCCAYVCPARRSMVQFMIHGKSEVLASRRS